MSLLAVGDALLNLLVPLVVVVAVLGAVVLARTHREGHPNFKRQRRAYATSWSAPSSRCSCC
jgi:hypothetical protein